MQVIHHKGSVHLFMSTEMLERRSEILKRNIHQLLVQENQHVVLILYFMLHTGFG
jgi:hypothetical protein